MTVVVDELAVTLVLTLLLGASIQDHVSGLVHDGWGIGIALVGLVWHISLGDPLASLGFGLIMSGVGWGIHRSRDLGGADAVLIGAMGFVFAMRSVVFLVSAGVALVAYAGTVYLVEKEVTVRVVPALFVAALATFLL